jgi:hypothetical protein
MLEPETCVKIREGCACVLSNEKSIYARTFRKLRKLYPNDDQYLDEVVKYLNATAPLRRCGEVTREGDRIYSVIGRGQCACPVLHEGLADPISITWCHCSAFTGTSFLTSSVRWRLSAQLLSARKTVAL